MDKSMAKEKRRYKEKRFIFVPDMYQGIIQYKKQIQYKQLKCTS